MPALFRRLASERLFLILLGVALFLPLCLSRARDVPFLGLPLVTSGDEPHYLVMVHSLLSDHDLDLSNNYDRARQGSVDIGLGRAGTPIDHQIAWYDERGHFRGWDTIYDYPRDAQGEPLPPPTLPQPKPGATLEFEGRPQYSQHPPGLALLLAPLVYPARGTRWVEHLSLLWSALATLGCALFVRELVRGFSKDAATVNAATLLIILGSPTWHYGRVLFVEPWLALSAVGALALATRRRSYFLAGVFLAVGVQMKPPFALLAVPLFVDRVLSRELKQAVSFAVPLGLSVAGVLWENQLFFGSPVRAAQPWESGNLLTGTLGGLFSLEHGLLPFCPLVLVAVLGWRTLLRAHRREVWLALGMIVPYVALMFLWRCWWGGYCYGPRLIAPIIPLVLLGVCPVLESFSSLSPAKRRFVVGASSLSVLISALGALVHLAFWEKHPLIEPFAQLVKHL